MQTNELWLVLKYYLQNNIYVYKQDLSLNNEKMLIFHKTQPNNHPKNTTTKWTLIFLVQSSDRFIRLIYQPGKKVN